MAKGKRDGRANKLSTPILKQKKDDVEQDPMEEGEVLDSGGGREDEVERGVGRAML